MVHSYGGWPGSGALEHISDRVSSIVWVDAFKPDNGQKGVDYASPFSRKAMEEAVAKGTPGRAAPAPSAFGVNEKDQAWVKSKLTDQPNGVATQPTVQDDVHSNITARDVRDHTCLSDTGSRITSVKNQRARRAALARHDATVDVRCASFGRAYNRDDIQATGAIDLADALRRLDPAVR